MSIINKILKKLSRELFWIIVFCLFYIEFKLEIIIVSNIGF